MGNDTERARGPLMPAQTYGEATSDAKIYGETAAPSGNTEELIQSWVENDTRNTHGEARSLLASVSREYWEMKLREYETIARRLGHGRTNQAT
jgi:hypothetical protein